MSGGGNNAIHYFNTGVGSGSNQLLVLDREPILPLQDIPSPISVGDITTPTSSTDNAIVRWDGTTGKIIQNSLGILSDLGDLTSLTGLEVDGSNNINLTSTLNSDPSIVINSNHALGSIELQQEGTNRIKINTTGLGFFNSGGFESIILPQIYVV